MSAAQHAACSAAHCTVQHNGASSGPAALTGAAAGSGQPQLHRSSLVSAAACMGAGAPLPPRRRFYNGNAQVEPGAVVCRVARCFVRFGTFQLPASRGEDQAPLVAQLVDHVVRHHYPDLAGERTHKLATQTTSKRLEVKACLLVRVKPTCLCACVLAVLCEAPPPAHGDAQGCCREEGCCRELRPFVCAPEAPLPGAGRRPSAGAPNPAAALYQEVCSRTARLVAEWQRVGFVHGVLNTGAPSTLRRQWGCVGRTLAPLPGRTESWVAQMYRGLHGPCAEPRLVVYVCTRASLCFADNMSILGDTIDFGPYGWLERFDPDFTPNTTDLPGRRYSYKCAAFSFCSGGCTRGTAGVRHKAAGAAAPLLWPGRAPLCCHLARPPACRRAQPEIGQFNLLQLAQSLISTGLLSEVSALFPFSPADPRTPPFLRTTSRGGAPGAPAALPGRRHASGGRPSGSAEQWQGSKHGSHRTAAMRSATASVLCAGLRACSSAGLLSAPWHWWPRCLPRPPLAPTPPRRTRRARACIATLSSWPTRTSARLRPSWGWPRTTGSSTWA